MSMERGQIDIIKHHFARKSAAQLEEILRSDDHELWSMEARVAAQEVLEERQAGLGEEPAEPEAERPRPPPAPVEDPYSLLFLFGIGVLAANGIFVIPGGRGAQPEEEPTDQPVPFGPKVAWLAVDSTDTEEVATALGLHDVRPARWQEGVDAAHKSSVFVTPPVADWTLAVGTALIPPNRVDDFVKPLLELLSQQFGEAQYFCTHADVDLQVWARARKGRLLRGHAWLGKRELTLWNEGAVSSAERHLGVKFFDQGPPGIDRGQAHEIEPVDENTVMQLACLWSVDPSGLDADVEEPKEGLLGTFG